MKTRDKDLAAFEKYLFSFMSEATPSTPLTNEEVVAILQNDDSPEEPTAEEKEQIIKIMKQTHERRKYVKRKMQNFNLIHSVGELFQLFCEWQNLSSTWLARLLNLTEEQFEAYQKDKVSPIELGKERILNFAALAGVSIQEMIKLLEKTVKLLALKPTVNLAAGHTRVYKEGNDSEIFVIRESAVKELLLALEAPKEEASSQENWEALRRELLKAEADEHSVLGASNQCLTILDKSRRRYANIVLQQI